MLSKRNKDLKMEELKHKIAMESIATLATHYGTTANNVALALQNGNTKLLNEVNTLCEKTLELLYA